ncbi:hypothetical protein BH18VER2_BH18VER2_16080 [soil metagenome]
MEEEREHFSAKEVAEKFLKNLLRLRRRFLSAAFLAARCVDRWDYVAGWRI